MFTKNLQTWKGKLSVTFACNPNAVYPGLLWVKEKAELIHLAWPRKDKTINKGGKKRPQCKLIMSQSVEILSLVYNLQHRRLCVSKSPRPLLRGGNNWNFRVDDISLWYERPLLPSTMRGPSPGCTDWFHLPPQTATPVLETEGHVTKLRFKEVKSGFMGNYANLCSEIGVKNLSPKTVAKLAFLIGNLFQVDSHLLSSLTVTDKSYLLPPRGY